MPTLDFKTTIGASRQALFDWHAQPGALERLIPPWAPLELKKHEGIRDGDRAVLRLNLGPLQLKGIAEHRAFEEGHQFEDVQVKGPFRRWTHTHRMEDDPADPEASVLHDHLTYELPLNGLGGTAEKPVRSAIERQFAYRHRIVQQDLPRHQRYDTRPLRVAVSGSHGLIGSHLMPLLQTGGHEVYRLVRSRSSAGAADIYWNHFRQEVEREKLEGLDAVIHLAGENVFAPRWTDRKKARIYGSRVRGTRLLADTLAALDDPPDAFISASAVGYYGDRGAERLTEESTPGEAGFFPAVCREWEEAAHSAAEAGIRTVQMRTGIVLTPAGGALALMRWPFQLGLGGTAGREDQWFPWIALDDVLWGYYHALMTSALEGPVNLTAPHPVTMKTFVTTLARVLRRPAPFHVPPAALRLLMGEAADELALTSERALPERLEASDYTFCYPALEGALRHQLGRTRAPLASA